MNKSFKWKWKHYFAISSFAYRYQGNKFGCILIISKVSILLEVKLVLEQK